MCASWLNKHAHEFVGSVVIADNKRNDYSLERRLGEIAADDLQVAKDAVQAPRSAARLHAGEKAGLRAGGSP